MSCTLLPHYKTYKKHYKLQKRYKLQTLQKLNQNINMDAKFYATDQAMLYIVILTYYENPSAVNINVINSGVMTPYLV